MPLETATFIHQLNATNPLGSDPVAAGDDHIRMIKSAIKATFPAITGPVTVSHSDINDKVPNAVQKDGSVAMTGPLTLSGNAVNALHAVPKQQLDAGLALAMPTGGIIMWSGTIATIPTGWAICNGLNGTPDLRDRFIIGASQDGSGTARTNITGSLTQTGGTKDAIVVTHSHTITDPGHTHSNGIYNQLLSVSGSGTVTSWDNTNPSEPDLRGSGTIATVTTGITVDSTGSSGTNANLPPYYALAFIMKV